MIQEKRCGRCEKHKPLDAFRNDKSRKDGKYPTCKACVYAYSRSAKGRAAHQRWVDSGGLERAKAYAKTATAKLKRNERLKSNRQEVQKTRVRLQTTQAVKDGTLYVPTAWTCLGCRCQATEYHHHNYYDPLDVTPVCRDCHLKLHVYMRHNNIELIAPTRRETCQK